MPDAPFLFKARGYAVAVFIIAVAVLVRLAIGHFLGVTAPFVTLYPATILVVLIGQPKEALAAIVVGGVSAAFLFVDLSDAGHLSTLGIYCVSGVFLTAIAERLGRAKTEQARHVSEARFQAVYNTSMDAVFLSNPGTGDIISANPAACEMLGMTETEIRQAGRGAIVVQDEAFARGFAERPPRGRWRGELTFRRKDGSTFPVDVSSSLFTGPQGETLSSTIVRDITERKQSEETLNQGREDLARAQEVGQIGSWRLDIQRNILTWSDQNYRLFGVAPGTPMTYEKFLDIIHPDDREYVDIRWRASVRGEPYDIEHRIIQDGQVKWVREKAYLEFDERGRLLGGFGITQDITERKRAEDELRKARDELEMRVRERTEEVRRQANLLELTHDAIFVRDMQGQITFWNKGAEETYACLRELARGQISHNLLQTRFPKNVKELEDELLAKGRWEGELTQTACDGRRVTVLSRWALQSEGGRPTGILEINSDITKYRAAEDQLRQRQKLEALGTMAGGIAHDFNNILSAIIGFSELIHDHLPGESRDRRHVRRVIEAAMRGRDLVKQMLTFSRKTEEERKPVQLSGIVKETARMLRASIPTTIAVRVNVGSESGAILGDPVQIQQAIMNLVINAAHAMKEQGGAIDIELSDLTAGPSNAQALEPGAYMKLEVRDTGTGISPDVIDRIFDPFFSTKKSGEGTGLGLSVVMGIVEQAQGYITVESEPGKGSVFTVYFPAVQEESSISVETGDEPVPGGWETILLVDDVESLVEMEEELLAELGYQVVTQTKSREAVALFRLDPSRFDLVIADQTMPELTGIEMSREMMAVRPDIPILLATGHSDLVDADKAKSAGIKGFVMKPLTRSELARIVRKMLDEYKAPIRSA